MITTVHTKDELISALSNRSVLTIYIDGVIQMDCDTDKDCIFQINRQHITIIGKNGFIIVNLNGSSSDSFSVFKITSEAKDITFKNINIEVEHKTGYINKNLCVITNFAKNTVINGCNIKLEGCAYNLACIINDGNLNTTLETLADNCIFSDNTIICKYKDKLKGSAYGIINIFANSAMICGNDILVQNDAKEARAICLYNSGRFLMVKQNKYNSTSFQGDAIAVYNNGMYMLFSKNDINVCGNKEYGFICIEGSYTRIEDNVITTSSQNAYTVAVSAVKCMILNNRHYGNEKKTALVSYGTLVHGNTDLGA